MEQYRVDVADPAEHDLMDIVKYIASQLSAPMTALNMLEFLETSMAGLSRFPQRYPLVSDERLALLGYRHLEAKNYIVFYTINEDEKVVDVERILYARRDWLNII